jgi:hypothetical protein
LFIWRQLTFEVDGTTSTAVGRDSHSLVAVDGPHLIGAEVARHPGAGGGSRVVLSFLSAKAKNRRKKKTAQGIEPRLRGTGVGGLGEGEG